MQLKLIVLAGAKQGTEIPLKKDKFVIGRAKECTLRAGSEAISRQHCVIRRRDKGWAVRDLGSRNGTFVNNDRIEQETLLAAGDELRVGPLRFRVAPIVKEATGKPAAKTQQAAPPEAAPRNAPKLKGAADRPAGKQDAATTEDGITRWLLGETENDSNATLKETRTIRMEDTRTMSRPSARPDPSAETPIAPEESSSPVPNEVPAAAEAMVENREDAEKSGWKWLKLGKGEAKKKPGKLPERPADSSKDSREAAADILREMTRRR